MKKLMTALLTLTLLVGMVIPVSAATADVSTAVDGDLIYDFNFNGEFGVWTPSVSMVFAENYTATVSEDGSSVTIKSNEECPNDVRGVWGGVIEGLNFSDLGTYTMVYKAKANGTANVDNKVAVASLLKHYTDMSSYMEAMGMRGSYIGTDNTKAEFAPVLRDTIFGMNGNWGLTSDTFVSAATIKEKASKDIDVDADGFLTLRVLYDAEKTQMHVYVLSKDGDVRVDNNWIWVGGMNSTDTAKIGLMLTVSGSAVDTTVKDVKIFKGNGWGRDHIKGERVVDINFNGVDGVYAPVKSSDFDERYDAIISEDGSTIQVKSNDETQWDTSTVYRYFGAKLSGYKVYDGESYTFVYQVKKEGTVGENALCIGNYYLDWNPNQVQGIKGWFTTDQAGAQVNAWINYGEKDLKTTLTDYDVDEDGFMTVMMVVENQADSTNTNMTVYVLNADGDVYNDADWTQAFTFAGGNSNGASANDLAFFVGGSAYTHKLDTTIRNARLYYGAGYGIDPATCTAPTANELTYTGERQELITAGAAVGGTMKYKLGAYGEWGTEIPTGKVAGTYTVYYGVVGDGNHTGIEPQSIEVTIAAVVEDDNNRNEGNTENEGNTGNDDESIKNTGDNVIMYVIVMFAAVTMICGAFVGRKVSR